MDFIFLIVSIIIITTASYFLFKNLMMLILIFALTAIVSIAGIRFVKTNESNTPEHIEKSYNIRLTSTLGEYSLPIPGIEFVINKYDGSDYKNIISKFDFLHTINKYIDVSSSIDEDVQTLYKSITPNVFSAAHGYYEIALKQNDNYFKIEPFRFYIDSEANIQVVGETDRGIHYGQGYEQNAKLYNTEGTELYILKDEQIHIIEFEFKAKNVALIKNLASDYNQSLIPPDGYEYNNYESVFAVSILNDDKSWVRLKNPDGTIKKFPAELEKYGGGNRWDKTEGIYRNYQYIYTDGISLLPNKKYKVEQISNPTGYNNTYNQSSPILFNFTFSTDDNCKLEFPVMESKTYAFFSDEYKKLFGTENYYLYVSEPEEDEFNLNPGLSRDINYTVLHTICIKEIK